MCTVSLDHLVGGYRQLVRDGEAERFGGLEIDHQLELVGDCAGRSAGFVPRKIRST
jgi:hypothetical protein